MLFYMQKPNLYLRKKQSSKSRRKHLVDKKQRLKKRTDMESSN